MKFLKNLVEAVQEIRLESKEISLERRSIIGYSHPNFAVYPEAPNSKKYLPTHLDKNSLEQVLRNVEFEVGLELKRFYVENIGKEYGVQLYTFTIPSTSSIVAEMGCTSRGISVSPVDGFFNAYSDFLPCGDHQGYAVPSLRSIAKIENPFLREFIASFYENIERVGRRK